MEEKLVGTITVDRYQLNDVVTILLVNDYIIKLKKYNEDKMHIYIYEETKNNISILDNALRVNKDGTINVESEKN